MSTADDPDRPPPDQRSSVAPGRARMLIALTVLGAVVLVIAFMLLVSQCGTDEDNEVVGAVGTTTAVSAVQ
jgi:hypothetical protein